MSERYTRLFHLPENLYAEGSPVIIAAGALLKDNQTGQVIAQLKLRNISSKAIKAATVSLLPMNTAGKPLGEAICYEYLDLSSTRDTDFGSKSAIFMPNVSTRSFSAAVVEVLFVDNSVWNANDATWEMLKSPESLTSRLDSEMAKQFRIEYGSGAKNFFLEQKDLWHCVCGAVNRREEKACHSCRRAICDLRGIDLDALKTLKERRLIREREQAEKEAAAARESARKTMKAVAIVVSAVAAVVAFFFVLDTVIIPNGKYSDAVALMEAGEFEKAITAFEELNGYSDSSEKIFDCKTAILDRKYNEAIVLMHDGKYEEAIAAFEKLNGYSDSSRKIFSCKTAILDGKYSEAIALMDNGKYEEAIAAFEALNGYRESAEQIVACQTSILEIELDKEYNAAISLMNNGSIEDAYKAFMELDSYKDSAEKAGDIRLQINLDKIKTAKCGSRVTFGAYEQDNNTSNGKEDVSWEVLDRKGNRLLLISTFALDHLPFDQTGEGNTWETCSLRNWLNSTFLDTTFAFAEKELIPVVTVSANKSPKYYQFNKTIGNDTQDRVFLLSTIEYETLIESRGYGAVSRGSATDYAIARGSTADEYGNYSSWWLRTPGSASFCVCTYYVGSGLSYGGSEIWKGKDVRPALWLDLDKLILQ